VVGLEFGQETSARQAPAKTCLFPNGLDPYRFAIERKINFVTRCDSQTVAHRFRDHHLPLGANTVSHTSEYNCPPCPRQPGKARSWGPNLTTYMCGRFTLTQSRYALEGFFHVRPENDHVDDRVYVPHYNFPPTEQVPGARIGKDGEMRLDAYRWGFVPSWVRNIAEFKLTTINARSETVAKAKAKTYASAFRSHRLLVPADSFFEWDRTDPKNKQPYLFARRDGEPIVFAGLYDSYLHPDTSEGEHWIATCTILTTAANEDMPIHDRLPLILERDVWERWIDPELHDVDELEGMVGVASSGVLTHFPVDRKVGSVKNDDASCIERVDLSTATLF